MKKKSSTARIGPRGPKTGIRPSGPHQDKSKKKLREAIEKEIQEEIGPLPDHLAQTALDFLAQI